MSKANTIFKCPCCTRTRYSTGFSACLELMKVIFKQEYPRSYTENKKDIIYSFANADLIWACDECLSTKKAIKSVPAAIETSGYPPLAYFDRDKICSTCKTPFIFSKEEQKFWYENLKFNIDATANNCVDCRAIIRKQKRDNNRLATLLKKEAPLSKKELEEIAGIYDRIGNEEKRNRYLNLAKKL